MKKNIRKRIALILGICLCSYPFVASLYEKYEQKNAIATYESQIGNQNDQIQESLERANKYNSMLHQANGAVMNNLEEGILSHENYMKELNLTGNGMMGSLEIPKISVDLPIYHGTEEDVLSVAVGHIEGTSLPVGGPNTHSVLTAHRGLPSSKLFTRLDELEFGDLFYIQICNQTLAYRVKEIQVVKPENSEFMEIQQDQDLISLVTCHPYGINSHRLIVTGERTTYEPKEYQALEGQMPSIREIFFTVLPFIMIAIAIGNYVAERRGENRAKEKKI